MQFQVGQDPVHDLSEHQVQEPLALPLFFVAPPPRLPRAGGADNCRDRKFTLHTALESTEDLVVEGRDSSMHSKAGPLASPRGGGEPPD